ncbi:MAG: HAMP domain-containing sensor histidine kinase, partial [Cyanobacteria bacterium P01_F01_bin.86]
KIYLDTGDEDARERFYEQVDVLANYFEELFEESEAMEEDSPYREDLINLNQAVERHFLLLESAIEHYETGTLTPATQLDIAFQISEARLNAQTALQALVEGDIVEREWDIADTSVSINNDLWLSSVTVGLGCITLGILYGWLMTTLKQQMQIASKLQVENQVLAQKLNKQIVNSQTIQSALDTELNRRQEMEATYKEIEAAKELTDLKLNFFSLASHELRTPLSAILVSAQLLDNPHAAWSEAKRSRNLKRIQSAAKTMTQLLADILLLTRAEAGKLEFHPQRIELPDFCQRLAEEVKFNTQSQHSIAVIQQGDSNYAYLDEKLLRAMLMSLLTNAIKYSPQESEIQFRVLGKEGHTCFQIQDQGIGVPAADQQRLFESFHRGQNAKNVSGTGLGLAVVRKCLDLHGGTIDIESQVGIGTTFTVELPWEEQPAINSTQLSP